MDHRLPAAMRTSAFLALMQFAGHSLAQTVATPPLTTVAPTQIVTMPQWPSASGAYYARPSWDQTLPCTAPAACPRFVLLSNMNNEAVLDLNTGLVWERSPLPAPTSWSAAFGYCNEQVTGGVAGWRLPKVQELASLTDLSVYATPAPAVLLGLKVLPPGHPFINVQYLYWAANTSGSSPTDAYYVNFNRLRTLSAVTSTSSKINPLSVWCVRGGAGGDVQ